MSDRQPEGSAATRRPWVARGLLPGPTMEIRTAGDGRGAAPPIGKVWSPDDAALIVQAVNEYEALRTIEKAIRPEHPGKPLTQKAEDAIGAAILRLNDIRGDPSMTDREPQESRSAATPSMVVLLEVLQTLGGTAANDDDLVGAEIADEGLTALVGLASTLTEIAVEVVLADDLNVETQLAALWQIVKRHSAIAREALGVEA